MKKRLFCFMLTFAVVLNLFIMPTVSTETYAAEQNVLPGRQIVVSGNKLVYQDTGEHVVLRGLNIPSLDFDWFTNGGEHMYESLTEACDSWNANIIRLGVVTKRWFDRGTLSGTWNNTNSKEDEREMYKNQYRLTIDNMVKGVAARGKYIIIDNHQYTTTLEEDLEFWLEMCELYGNHPNVLFGLLNEPVSIVGTKDLVTGIDDSTRTQWDLWRNGGYVTGPNRYKTGETVFKSVGMQPLVEAIRNTGAKNILIAGGLSWGYDLRGIVGEANNDTTIYALEDKGSGANGLDKAGYGIMYDTHIYPSKGDTAAWETAVGGVRAKYPILVGEFGWDSIDSATSPSDPTRTVHSIWMPEFKKWMDDADGKYDSPANWTGWCFHMGSSPRVLKNWQYEPTDFLGAYIKEWLREEPRLHDPITNTYNYTFDTEVTASNKFNSAGVKPYRIDIDGGSLTNSVAENKLTINYSRSASGTKIVDCLKIPLDWVLDGLQTLEFNMQADSFAVGTQLRIGFEKSDTTTWTKDITIANTNNNRIVIPVNELERAGNQLHDGVFDSALYNIYIGVLNQSKGKLEISNLQITTAANPSIQNPPSKPYIPNTPDYVFDLTTPEKTVTITSNPPAVSSGDDYSAVIEDGIGYRGNPGIRVDHKVINKDVSGNAKIDFPIQRGDLKDAKYLSFFIKGLGAVDKSGKPVNTRAEIVGQYPSGVAKQSIVVSIPAGDTNWRHYVYRMDDVSIFDTASLIGVRSYTKPGGHGSYIISDISVTTEQPEIVIPNTVKNGFENDFITWTYSGGGQGDTMTGRRVDEGGFMSQSAFRLTYKRPADAPGMTAQAAWPKSWDLTNVNTLMFDARSISGKTEKIGIKLVDKLGYVIADLKDDRAFQLEGDGEWKRFAVSLKDFTIFEKYEIFPERQVAIQFQNLQDDHEGGILIDNLTFTNVDVPFPEGSVNYYLDPLKGTWTQDTVHATINISAKPTRGGGFKGGNGLEFSTMGALNSNTRRVSLTNEFPVDWDFNKVSFLSFMVRGGLGNPINDSITKSVNRFTIQLYNNTTLVASMDADALVGRWSNIILPISFKTNDASVIKGTNILKVTSTSGQPAVFVMSDILFSSHKPERTATADRLVYIDDMNNYTALNIAPKYGSIYRRQKDTDGNDIPSSMETPSLEYIYAMNNGSRQHYGLKLQHLIYEDTKPREGSTEQIYVSSGIPISCDLKKATHFQLDAKLMVVKGNGVSGNEWAYKNFAAPSSGLTGDQFFGPLTPAAQPSDDIIRFALVDLDGEEYSAVKTFNKTTWDTYSIPLDDFTNKKGNAPNFSEITQLRIYPEKYGTHSGMHFDNMGFVQESRESDYAEVDNVTVKNGSINLLTDGLIPGDAEITASIMNYTGDNTLSASVAAVLYDKDLQTPTMIKTVVETKALSVSGENTISFTINIPENIDDYIMRIFTWNSNNSFDSMKPLTGYIQSNITSN